VSSMQVTKEMQALAGLSVEQLVARIRADPKLRDMIKRATAHMIWVPQPGAQTRAFDCVADELFYGGSSGGGKTDLGLGLALTRHKRSLILRRLRTDAAKLANRVEAIVGHRNGFNGQALSWRFDDGRLIDFAGCEQESDKQRFKGTPHDLIFYDEGSDFVYSQYQFINGWNRSTDAKQRCRIIVASNPPTSPEGLWVLRHWAPWLDPMHPRPARPGDLRWFVVGESGEDIDVDGPGEYPIGGEMFAARSRTYIPAKLSDNIYQNTAAYRGVLASLPPELRAAYRDGSFQTGMQDDAYQVIPSAWIEAAQARWRPDGGMQAPMTAIAVDIAMGGTDWTVLAARRNGWYEPLVRKPGAETREGSDVAAMVVRARQDNCPVVIDCGGGWGAAAAAALERNGIQVEAYLGIGATIATVRDGGKLKFANRRAECWWRFREELNPDQPGGSAIALPPDASIRADLAAPRWELTPRGIKIEDKDEIKKRLGRSPDDGDAITMCLSEGARAAKRQLRQQMGGGRQERANTDNEHMKGLGRR
jgi:hypothetical protein